MSRPQSDEQIIDRYRLHAAIASGSMGTVHLGCDLDTGRAVAIKHLHPQLAADATFAERILDTAQSVSCVTHTNVVQTVNALCVGDGVFVVTEYVPAESLARLVYGKARPPWPIIVTVLLDVLRGLQAAHTAATKWGAPHDLVHGDLCPESILVGTDGIARIFDFAVEPSRPAPPSKAKLAYMAPERVAGEHATPYTDLYAVGVLLWQLVTGKRLFKGERTRAVIASILEGEVPALMRATLATTAGKLSAAAMAELARLEAVMMRAVSQGRAARYESAHEMAGELALSLDPASPEDIAAWVTSTAHDVLSVRAEMVAELNRVVASAGAEDGAAPDSEPPTLALPDPTLLPIIVADLVDKSALTAVAAVAEARGTMFVPLLNPPADAGDHVLEVHIPEEEEPMLFFARPVGGPETRGFPLALRPHGTRVRSDDAEPPSPAESVEAREAVVHALSESHSRDLTFSGSAEQAHVEANVLGRTLQVQGGRLVLEERLGAGGGGAVYRGRYIDDARRDVAVKVQHDRGQRSLEASTRFHREALAASKLDHRNLVRVIDFGQEPDGLLHLTMEYLEGSSLRQVLEAEGPLPMDRAVHLLGQVCAGLAHAHRSGVVHRDVKPSNVILVTQQDDDGRAVTVAKVCDFGLATGPATALAGELSGERVTGTPQYMSPEQCRGEEVDARSDVYSCGVMLYELVTGQLPFKGRDRKDFRRLHQLATPTPPSTHLPDIDPQLEQVILKALAKTPEGRQQSMLELRGALKELLEPGFGGNASPSMLPPPRVSGRPSAMPAAPAASAAAPEGAQPLERSLDSLVTLLRSLSEMPHAPPGRLREIEHATEDLEGTLKYLAQRGDAASLGQVINAMAVVCGEAAHAPSTEMWTQYATKCAGRVLHTIADPATLEPFARKLLDASAEPTEAELSLLVWSKVAGAYALYAARKALETRSARTRFVSALRLIGAAGLPVVRGALEELWPADAESAAQVTYLSQPTLVIDLLRSVPGTKDETLGIVISRYARSPDPEIQGAALATLVHVWGERATPALLAGMQSAHERVRITALRGVKTIGGIDELAVRRIEAMLVHRSGPPLPAVSYGSSVSGASLGASRNGDVSDELRVAAADALAYAAEGARAEAARAVLRVLREVEPSVNNTVAIAFARAALALASADARQVIEEVAARGPETLRGALRALL